MSWRLAPLRERHQQPVLVLRVVAAERIPRADSLGRAPVEHVSDRCVEGDRELADRRGLVQQLDAVDRAEALPRVGGAANEQLPELDEASLAEPGEVDHAGQRVERLGGADVVGRLLAADVLLAGLEREHEAAAAVDVGRLACDPAGHAADVLLSRAEEAERGAAVVEAVAERLALAHGDVCTALARGPQDRESDRIAGDDHERTVLLRRRAERLDVLDGPEEVRLLQEDRGGLVIDRFRQGGRVGDPIGKRDLDQLGPIARRRR